MTRTRRSERAGRESIQPAGGFGLWAGFLRQRCPRLLRQKGQCHQSPRLPDSARRPAFPSGPRGTRVAILKRKRARKTRKNRLSEKSDGFGYSSTRLSTSVNKPGDPGPTPPPQRPLFLSLSAFASPLSHFLRGSTGFALLSPVLWPS